MPHCVNFRISGYQKVKVNIRSLIRTLLELIPKSLLRTLSKLLPKRFRLPARYGYHRVFGQIEEELFMLQDLVGTGQTAIDVGANFGIWSYKLSKLFQKVEAFEPLVDCTAEIKAFRAKNITVHDVALSSAEGFNELHISVAKGRLQHGLATFSNVAGEHRTILVPVRTLDSYNFSNVAFIKIDVEGHELEVIKGAETTIAREKPLMLVEIEQRHLNFAMDIVIEKVLGFGYEAFFLYSGQWRPYVEFSYEVHQEPFLSDVNSKRYVNDFLFKPRV